tara:strand:- start:2327 stop:3658 length:1332 start_codon:yes stop_codon:yes gene_type:complete
MHNPVKISNKIKKFNEKISVSGDKSISIRCVLLATQAIGISRIYNLLESEDVLNALKSIKRLGVNYKKKKNFYEIESFGLRSLNKLNRVVVNAGNSGTLARLILGILVDNDNEVTLKGDNSLSGRDFTRVIEPLKKFGVNFIVKKKNLPLIIKGTKFLRPINYYEKLGSAQCKSAVMLAALKTPGITKIKAKKSRNHTELMFKELEIPIKVIKEKYYDLIEIRGLTNFNSFEYRVPGDLSSSAFFLVLTLLSKESKIRITNVNINETRTGIIKILNRMNAKIVYKNKKKYKGEIVSDILVKSVNNLKGIRCPKSLNSSAIDEFLIIFLVAAKAKGISTFSDLGELNKKESPRLNIAIKLLKMMGIKILRKNNDIKIYGNPKLNLKGKFIVKNYNKDHRIFMMSCIAALTFGGNWKIFDKDSTYTSFPHFLKIIKQLGADIIEN